MKWVLQILLVAFQGKITKTSGKIFVYFKTAQLQWHVQTYELTALLELKLEQLERLRSEDTPRRPMITPYYWPVYFESQVHIIDQLISDPKSKQGESWKIRKICEKLKF